MRSSKLRWCVLSGSKIVALLLLAACGPTDLESGPIDELQEALATPKALPARIEAEQFDRFSDSDTTHSGNCGSGPVDQELTTDTNGGACHVAYTNTGEWLEYDVTSASPQTISLTARVASAYTGKTVRIELDGQFVGRVTAPASGWQAFADRTLTNVALPAGNHVLRVVFENGQVNLNYLDLRATRIALPSRVEAEHFVRFSDTDSAHSGNCGSGPVDAELTTDPNGGACNVGWTYANEWLEYDVSSSQARVVNLTARLASAYANTTVRVKLDGATLGTLTAPSAGWQAFADRTIPNVNLGAGNHVLRVEFVSGQTNLNYLDVTSTTTPPAPSTWTKTDKVLVLNYDPIMPSGQRLHVERGWYDPHSLATQYASDMNTSSGGVITYNIVQFNDINAFTILDNDYQYNPTTYNQCLADQSTCQRYPDYPFNPRLIDYVDLVNEHNLCNRAVAGEFDEVWLFGGAYFGYYESTMAGTNAFWVNSPPVPVACSKRFIIMGFSTEVPIQNMLHDFGHRLDSTLNQAFMGWSGSPNPATQFQAYNRINPGNSGCGDTHNPPNASQDYQYDATTSVLSNCASWDGWPVLSGAAQNIGCSPWGCNERGFHMWRHDHLPHNSGTTQGFQNDWWKYVLDYNTYL